MNQAKTEKPYTAAMLRKFDRLTLRTASINQLKRINARLDLQKFVKEHGEEACNAMREHLKKRGKW